MAKRRADQLLFHSLSPKRCARNMSSPPPCGLESLNGWAWGLRPPSMLYLLPSRRRKRAFYPEDEENKEMPRTSQTLGSDCPVGGPGCVLLDCGSVQKKSDSANSTASTQNPRKRTRKDTASSKHGSAELVTLRDESCGDDMGDLSRYNSFQYWRVPLPTLDLSVLEVEHLAAPQCTPLDNHLSCDAMET